MPHRTRQDAARAHQPLRWRAVQHSATRGWLVGAWVATCVLIGCGTAISPWVPMAEDAYATGDVAAAVAYYELALGETPDDLVVHTRLAILLLEQAETLAAAGSMAVADERYERACALGGTAVVTASLLVRHADIRASAGRAWAAQAELLEKARALEPSEVILRRLAYGYDQADDLAHAIETMRALAEADPQDAGVVLRWAQLEEASGELERAREGYARLLQLEPSSVAGRIGLAGLYERSGEAAQAEALYRAVVGENPDHLGAWRQLRQFHQRMGNDEAVAEVEESMSARWPDERKAKRPLR